MTMTEGSKFQEQAEAKAKAKAWLKEELVGGTGKLEDPDLRAFGWALDAAVGGGKRIARRSWGPDHWVCYMQPTLIHADHVNTRTRKFIPEGPLNVQGYFVVYTKTPDAPNSVSSESTWGKWQPGWVPSTEDLLATDWTTLN